MRTIQKLFCLVAVGVCTLAACRSRAQGVEVDWDSSDGFVPSAITINAGTEVDFVNMDDTYDLQITGNPPESFSADVPPTDGVDLYYVPYVYNNPGVFSASDEFGNSVIITVNSVTVTPLSVAITSPTNDTAYTVPATFTVSATPTGGSGTYLDVEFLAGTNDVGDIISSPYSTIVSNLPVGSNVISVIVTDSDLNSASNSIDVIVTPPIGTNYIAPVACADIYSSGTVEPGPGGELEVYADPHAGLEFPAFNASQYTSILLELYPYAEPLFGPTVSVYGFDGANGTLVASNYNSGTLIGTGTFPSEYFQFDFVDVTAFVKSVKGPYFGFILVSSGIDFFCSTTENYGTPPELFAIGPVLPNLSATRAGNQMIVSWPTNNSAGYSLQSATNLLPPATWNAVAQTPALVGTNWMVTNSIFGNSGFFRLSYP